MKLGIHKSPWGFSEDWISYCQNRGIPYKIVNCYRSDIIEQLNECDALMWHHHHTSAKDFLFAKELLFALEQSGIKVFPDFNTGWHFDDKVGQKYLLEAIDAPIVPTYVFYNKTEALEWADSTVFPKVFKLRGGAGSNNVRLVETRQQAHRYIKKMFESGYPNYDRFNDLREQIRRLKIGSGSWFKLLKSIRRLFVSTQFAKYKGPERGYVLFQDFIPENDYDIRVIVIGNRAFAIKRIVRENDFRASGSGKVEYAKEAIDLSCVKTAFDTAKKLKTQSVGFDFVFDSNNNPLIVEINYAYAKEVYEPCLGYWDDQLNWHEGKFNSMGWMIEYLIEDL